MFNHILVALDGSRHAYKALDIATDIAQKYEATVLLLYVITKQSVPPILGRRSAETAAEVYKKLGAEVAENVLRKGKKRAKKNGLGSVQTATTEGYPAKAIVKFANKRGIDLIVMGTRGLTGLKDLVMGSVAHKVIALSKCPVVTTK